jgi:hypothetical protein
MATTTSLTTSFVGEAATATELINKMYFGAKTVGDGNITIKDDVNKAHHIRRLTGSGMIQTPTCDFTPTGTITIDEQILTPTPFEVNLQMCKKDFKHVDWSSVRMGTGGNRQMAQDVIDSVITEIIGHVGQEIEYSIWRGNTAGATYTLIDGLIKLLTAGVAAGNKTTPAAVTASTVVAQLGAAYDIAAAQPWFDAPDIMYWVAPNVMAAYKQALANQGFMDQYQAGDKPENYVGIPMVVAPGLEASQFTLSHKSNFYFGTESVSNFNEIFLKDMHEVDLSDNVRFAAYSVMGVQVGWFEEAVLHLAS